MIYTANQLTGFYTRATLALNGLKLLQLPTAELHTTHDLWDSRVKIQLESVISWILGSIYNQKFAMNLAIICGVCGWKIVTVNNKNTRSRYRDTDTDIGKQNTDRFASSFNKQLQKFNSWVPKEEANVIIAISPS